MNKTKVSREFLPLHDPWSVCPVLYVVYKKLQLNIKLFLEMGPCTEI